MKMTQVVYFPPCIPEVSELSPCRNTCYLTGKF